LLRSIIPAVRSGCWIPGGTQWGQHFKLDGPIIQPLTPVGEVTARMLRLNAAERVIERRLFQALGSLPKGLTQPLNGPQLRKNGRRSSLLVQPQPTRRGSGKGAPRSRALSAEDEGTRPAASRIWRGLPSLFVSSILWRSNASPGQSLV
jgi:hypothetical protein